MACETCYTCTSHPFSLPTKDICNFIVIPSVLFRFLLPSAASSWSAIPPSHSSPSLSPSSALNNLSFFFVFLVSYCLRFVDRLCFSLIKRIYTQLSNCQCLLTNVNQLYCIYVHIWTPAYLAHFKNLSLATQRDYLKKCILRCSEHVFCASCDTKIALVMYVHFTYYYARILCFRTTDKYRLKHLDILVTVITKQANSEFIYSNIMFTL